MMLPQKKFEDTKWVTTSRNLKKDKQYNGQKTKDKNKRTNNGLQKTTKKHKATRTPLKPDMNSGVPEG